MAVLRTQLLTMGMVTRQPCCLLTPAKLPVRPRKQMQVSSTPSVRIVGWSTLIPGDNASCLSGKHRFALGKSPGADMRVANYHLGTGKSE